MNIILDIPNLNQRRYTHGTAILGGMVEYLRNLQVNFCGGKITDFSLRMHKAFYFRPKLTFSQEPPTEKYGVTGTFKSNGEQMYYWMIDSDVKCSEFNIVDEAAIESQIIDTGEFYTLEPSKFFHGEHPRFFPFICWSAIERVKNLEMFSAMNPSKTNMQMWFTGITLNNLDFLSDPIKTISSTKDHVFLSENACQRIILYNGHVVGTRVGVYGPK